MLYTVIKAVSLSSSFNLQILKNMLFTPAFIIFTLIFFFTSLLNRGRIACVWDEFSAWASSVKIMFFWDQFGTVKEANLAAANYPPGMACFQYFVEKINGTFSEWRLFFAYQIFTYSIFMPFLKDMKRERIFDALLISAILFFTPLFVLDHLFQSIYIDTFMGALFGVCVAFACFWEKVDAYYIVFLSFCMAMLVLCKPVGVFFAVLVAVFKCIRIANIKSRIELLKRVFLCSLTNGVPYVLWQINVQFSDCNIILNFS